ncbi:hypothetical protein RclHR1_00800027 [Rhizophagus clarus]|uniref:Protein kinase domain-containing protein n=1 Tax=Rhizophagus clarus TaxID=94130 RepID=A0A2Z6SE25_9GLOM|nr:hypothetical protein RclHR1_00800027 [Rhizophagus clarus]
MIEWSKFGTSENAILDNFILRKGIKWIPYNKFKNVEYLDEGGFGIAYKANWLSNDQNIEVALKYLNNLNENLDEFLNEWDFPEKCLISTWIIKTHGFTKNPDTSKYMIVFDYANRGNLRRNLTQIIENNWNQRLHKLLQIISSLNEIHELNLIHYDFHDGNILNHQVKYKENYKDKIYISDLGLCQPVKSFSKKHEIYGVIPFMAPEVLRGNPYTPASNIYSFSMIMWEFTSGVPPFNDKAHDLQLALSICKGDRPEILGNTPQCYVDLMKKCWNQNPLKRPSASEVKNIIIKWIYRPHGSFKDDEELISNIMEFINSSVVNNKPAFESHPQAFYTSRLFDFTSTEINKCLDCSVDDIKSSVAAYSNDDNDNKVSSDAKEPEDRK